MEVKQGGCSEQEGKENANIVSLVVYAVQIKRRGE
jgi:hypothetical protein